MSFYEFTGKSVKEAVAKACEELNTNEALLDVEVLEESTRGFLGIVGHKDARVRVRKRDIFKEVMEVEQAPPEEAEEGLEAGEEETFDDEHLGADQESSEEPHEEFEGSDEPVPDSPHMDEARSILCNILERLEMEFEVQSSMSGSAILLDIKGDGSGLLIGKKGQTLDALQYLVNKIINKSNPPGEKIEVVVDTENYRARKHENLKEMAFKVSQKAKKTLKPVSLNPMPAYERRIVHLLLADDREVYTKSYGEGQFRRIIVYPRRGTANKRRRR